MIIRLARASAAAASAAVPATVAAAATTALAAFAAAALAALHSISTQGLKVRASRGFIDDVFSWRNGDLARFPSSLRR